MLQVVPIKKLKKVSISSQCGIYNLKIINDKSSILTEIYVRKKIPNKQNLNI